MVSTTFTDATAKGEEVILDKDKVESPDVPVTVEPAPESVLKRLVPPHLLKSREVTESDVVRVVEESTILYSLCYEPNGLYRGAFAMHHAQIDDKDPLSFFVTWDKRIIINPKITRHTNQLVDSKEACMTFSGLEQIIVPRWHKLEVEYVTIMTDPEKEGGFKLSAPIQEALSAHAAFEFQHEFDHGEAKYIYPF